LVLAESVYVSASSERHRHIPVLWSSDGGEGVSTVARNGARNRDLRCCQVDKDGEWTAELDANLRSLVLQSFYERIEQGIPSIQCFGKIPVDGAHSCMERSNESG